MNAAEARGLYATMLAIWPSAKSNHGQDTAQMWVQILADTPTEDAQAAVVDLRVSADWFPSMAQFHQAVGDARFIRVERQVDRKAIAGPEFDVSGRARVAEMVAWLKQPREAIVAKDLDAAKVKNWRGRLRDARREDERFNTNANWDAAWAAIREELGRPPLTLPDGTTYG